MTASRFTNATDYGIGIGPHVPHSQHILEKKKPVTAHSGGRFYGVGV